MFDDSQEVDSLLGIVEVPLLPLAHGKDISGVFEISNRTLGGGAVGVMAVKMEWSMSYLPPSSLPDILTPDPTDRSDRVYSCDVDIGKLASLSFVLYCLCFFFKSSTSSCTPRTPSHFKVIRLTKSDKSSRLTLLQRFEKSYSLTPYCLTCSTFLISEAQQLLPVHYEQISREQDEERRKEEIRRMEELKRREEAALRRREEEQRLQEEELMKEQRKEPPLQHVSFPL